MKIRKTWIIVLLSTFTLFIGQAYAQDSTTTTTTTTDTSGLTKTEVVHCVAGPSGRTYCGATHTRYTLTGTPDPRCIENKTWGINSHGLWVMHGCVADFSPVITTTTSGQVINCSSTGDGRTYCQSVPNRHYLLSKIRAGNCVEGTTWGIDDHGLWVSGGCSGDFDFDND